MTTTTQTAFGRVLTELLEERGLEATPETVGWPILARMLSTDIPYPGSLAPLAEELDLSVEEMERLAVAFTLERE
jgi:hypothetical protein